MKTCPNCNEILGDSVNKCFNCNYSYELGRVITKEEMQEASRVVEEKNKKQQAEMQEKRERELQELREYQNNREKNALYEYEVVTLRDNSTGGFNVEEYRNILRKYSAEGWQLKTVFSNEIGKNTSSVGYGGLSYGTNATIDQTIITFERCIRPSSL